MFDLASAISESYDYFINDVLYENLSNAELANLISQRIESEYEEEVTTTEILEFINKL